MGVPPKLLQAFVFFSRIFLNPHKKGFFLLGINNSKVTCTMFFLLAKVKTFHTGFKLQAWEWFFSSPRNQCWLRWRRIICFLRIWMTWICEAYVFLDLNSFGEEDDFLGPTSGHKDRIWHSKNSPAWCLFELPPKQCCLLLGGCNKPRMSNEVSISGETTCCKPLMIYRYKCGLSLALTWI